jgi:uncharacterized membrane protein SpoIIM required for sporulation
MNDGGGLRQAGRHAHAHHEPSGSNAMNTELKRKIAFALSMGVVTTGIISLVLIVLNRGLAEGFVLAWLRSWGAGYLIVIPAILLIGPRLQARIDRLIR